MQPMAKFARFEDLKTDLSHWSILLDQIGVKRSLGEIERALHEVKSRPSHLENYSLTNPKGKPFEFLERMNRKEHDSLIGRNKMTEMVTRLFDYNVGPAELRNIFEPDL